MSGVDAYHLEGLRRQRNVNRMSSQGKRPATVDSNVSISQNRRQMTAGKLIGMKSDVSDEVPFKLPKRLNTEEDFSRVQELLKDEVEELDAPTLKITDPYEEPLTNEYRSNLLEKIFLFTVRETVSPASNGLSSPSYLLKLPSLTTQLRALGEDLILSEDLLDQALVERLHIADKSSLITRVKGGKSGRLFTEKMATESRVLFYFGQCFERVLSCDGRDPRVSILCRYCKDLLLTYVSTQLVSLSSLIPSSNPNSPQKQIEELLEQIYNGNADISLTFLIEVLNKLPSDKIKQLFLLGVQKTLSHVPVKADFPNPNMDRLLKVLQFLAKQVDLAEMVISSKIWIPAVQTSKEYSHNTILGRLLSLTPIPQEFGSLPKVFGEFAGQTETTLDNRAVYMQEEIQKIVDGVTEFVKNLLRHGGQVRTAVMEWIIGCFKTSTGRSQMISEYSDPMTQALQSFLHASDGFYLNLLWVMLKVAVPFSRGGLVQANKVDPNYTMCASLPSTSCGGPVLDLSGESALVVLEGGEPVHPSLPLSFSTHWFFLTQKCLTLTYPSAARPFLQLQQHAKKILADGVLANLSLVPDEQTVLKIKVLLSKYYVYKTHACHPGLLEAVMEFIAFVCDWMLWQLIASQPQDKEIENISYSLLNEDTLYFLQSGVTPGAFHRIPESVVEMIVDVVVMFQKLQPDLLYRIQLSLGLFVSIFAGWQHLLRNPHLRARLVEILIILMEKGQNESSLMLASYKEERFSAHPFFHLVLVESLLRIFIDTEHSGEDMLFEQKYRYRHQIYSILCKVWGEAEYRVTVQRLHKEAVEGYLQSTSILLLKFIHLLVNDAVAILDRALKALQSVHEIEQSEENGEWDGLSVDDRKAKEQEKEEAIENAKLSNQMSERAIQMVVEVARVTPEVMVLDTMVDRVAAMLNYFLRKLIGPERNELKVKEFKVVSFSPKDLLHSIVLVYTNLAHSKQFCAAVCSDERSYSRELLQETCMTLRRIQVPLPIILEFSAFSNQLEKAEKEEEIERNLALQAPSEFCDALMGTLMRDPVTLPNSQTVMDRVTILRHLMSKSEDPFTRSTLTPDMLQEEVELKQKIETWIKDKKDAKQESQLNTVTSAQEDEELEVDDEDDADLY